MSIYFIMIAFSLFWCSIYYLGKRVIYKIEDSLNYKSINIELFFIIMVSIPLIIIAGIREGLGTDFYSYKNAFTLIYEGYYEQMNFEIGFLILNILIANFTSNPMWLFLIASTITVLFIVRCCFLESDDPMMSIFLFVALGFYFYAFNAVRQYMSIAICFHAYRYIKNRELKKFIVSVILAMTFHKTALIMVPLYFILNKKLKLSQYIKIYLFLIILLPFGSKIRDVFIRLFYPIYWNSFRMKNFESVWSNTNIIISILVFIGCIIYYKKIMEKDEKNIIYINLAFFMLICSTTIPWLGEMGIRLSHYIIITSILIIPKIISVESNKYLRIIVKTMVYIVFFILLIRILLISKDTNNYFIPYMSVFKI